MARRSPTLWISSAVVAFVAMSAAAAPPHFGSQSRNYDGGVYGDSCWGIPGGQRCIGINAFESYDVKGTFQYIEAGVHTYFYRQFDDGSWRQSWRQISCPVAQTAISLLPKGASLEVTLDPGAPGCYSAGEIVTCDPAGNCQVSPWGFPGPVEVAGQWLDPFNYGSSVWTSRDSYHDGWTDTTGTNVRQCKESHGDVMTAGGFSVNADFFPFEGPNSPVASFFAITRCNVLFKGN